MILHDPPGLANGARGVMRPFNPGNVLGGNSTNGPGGFMMTSPPSKFGGAIPKKMPSPAAQVGFLLSLYYVTWCVCRPVGKILKFVEYENDRDDWTKVSVSLLQRMCWGTPLYFNRF